jgi:type II secretory pathway component GspD/PulD (secretin)
MLNETKGVNLLSAPRLVTRSGQRAAIEVIREFRYPSEFDFEQSIGIFIPKAFETRNLGVTLEVEPVGNAEGVIDLTLVPEVVRLDGYIRASDGQPVLLRNGRSVGADMTIKDFAAVKIPRDTVLQPVFSTSKITTSIAMMSGHTVVLGGLRKDDHEEGKEPVSRLLYVFVTARCVELAAKGPVVLPVAFINKADEEGFVRSPFAPESKPIDARGLPSGTELKCPVTKQLFRLQ